MCRSQILTIGSLEAQIVGLSYASCAAALSRYPDLDVPAVWDGLRVIEAAFVADARRRADSTR